MIERNLPDARLRERFSTALPRVVKSSSRPPFDLKETAGSSVMPQMAGMKAMSHTPAGSFRMEPTSGERVSEKLLPDGTELYGGQITVREESLDEGKGYYDAKNGEIVLEEDQPPSGKLIILLHELIHAAETAALRIGDLEERLPEHLVTMMAGMLGRCLMETDLVDFDIDDFS